MEKQARLLIHPVYAITILMLILILANYQGVRKLKIVPYAILRYCDYII
jgi:hypothetical protein